VCRTVVDESVLKQCPVRLVLMKLLHAPDHTHIHTHTHTHTHIHTHTHAHMHTHTHTHRHTHMHKHTYTQTHTHTHIHTHTHAHMHTHTYTHTHTRTHTHIQCAYRTYYHFSHLNDIRESNILKFKTGPIHESSPQRMRFSDLFCLKHSYNDHDDDSAAGRPPAFKFYDDENGDQERAKLQMCVYLEETLGYEEVDTIELPDMVDTWSRYRVEKELDPADHPVLETDELVLRLRTQEYHCASTRMLRVLLSVA